MIGSLILKFKVLVDSLVGGGLEASGLWGCKGVGLFGSRVWVFVRVWASLRVLGLYSGLFLRFRVLLVVWWEPKAKLRIPMGSEGLRVLISQGLSGSDLRRSGLPI